MTLAELKTLCDEANQQHVPIEFDIYGDDGLEFWKACRTYLPKLLAVAEAARLYFREPCHNHDVAAVRAGFVERALAALESE